jgi:hypothetical protein
MFYIDYGDKQILGDEDRAVNMVLWSKKQKDSGKTVSKVFDCGLTAKLVSDEEEPKLYLFWEQNKFNKFCSGSDVELSHYGINITMKEGNTSIIMQDSQEGIPLFMYEGTDDCPETVLGMVCLSWEGPIFFTEQECQLDIRSLQVDAYAEPVKNVTLNDRLNEKSYPKVTTRLLAAIKDLNLEYSGKSK